MTNAVNGEMIALAREARGLTQGALAEAVSLTQATISRYEAGWVEVPHEHLTAIAAVLRRPKSFFFWRERIYGASCLYHRRRQRISVRELKAIHAQVNILRIQATRLLNYTNVVSDYSFFRLDMAKIGSPEEVARRLRQLWQLPTGPVRNLVGSIESAGGVVFRCAFGSGRVDGISQWPLDAPTLPPIFFVSDAAPGDRQRWTLAHEIGHVVMHHMLTSDPEEEADKFAAEFMMPAADIAPELKNLTLEKAAALKSYWKVSMQAIIRTAHRLGKISVNQYEYLFKQLSARGYRKCEPVPVPAEEPQLMPEMMRVVRSTARKSVDDFSDYLGLLVDDLRAEYLPDLAGLRLVS